MINEEEYWPPFRGGQIVRKFISANYRAGLLIETESLSSFDYLFILFVFDLQLDKLCLCVVSERLNDRGRENLGVLTNYLGESFSMGVYPGQGHLNLGHSNDWSDIDKFTNQALREARGYLKMEDQFVQLSD